jgi:hypothetical protein
VLVLKFLYHMPLKRIRAMVRSAGLELSPGTLCGSCHSQLARQVYQEFAWLNAQSRLKEMGCKVALLRMD